MLRWTLIVVFAVAFLLHLWVWLHELYVANGVTLMSMLMMVYALLFWIAFALAWYSR